jgi:hypothetical protein
MNEIIIMLNQANEENIVFNKEQIDFFDKYLKELIEKSNKKAKQ